MKQEPYDTNTNANKQASYFALVNISSKLEHYHFSLKICTMIEQKLSGVIHFKI